MTRRRVPPGVIVSLSLLALALMVGLISARGSHVDIAPDAGSPTPAGAEVPTDGEHTGFVSDFGVGVIEFDPAELFYGADAEAAAAEDGELPLGGLPNPVYVRDGEGVTVRLTVAPGFEAVLLELEALQSRTLDAKELAAIYAGEGDAAWWLSAGPTAWPASLTVADGVVVGVEELYVP